MCESSLKRILWKSMNMSVRANGNRQKKRRQTGTSDSSQKPRLPATSSFLPAAMSMPGDFNTSVSLTPGFQKSSANTTRSAEEKVRPMLAAVMDSTATACLSDSWNCWHRSSRSAEEVEPSMRMCCTCCGNQGRKRGGLPHARDWPWLQGQDHACCSGSNVARASSMSLHTALELPVLSFLFFQIEICVEIIVDSQTV